MSRSGVWDRSARVGAIYLVAYCGIQFLYGTKIGFAPVYNDFLGLFQVSRLVEFNDWATLYNGFFPAGYIALLAIVPGEIASQVFGSISLLSVLLTLILTYLLARKFVGSNWALVVMFVLSVNPNRCC